MTEQVTIKNVITEDELIDLFGISKANLDDLRYNYKLPFYKINKLSRVYLEQDVIDWLVPRKQVLNKDTE